MKTNNSISFFLKITDRTLREGQWEDVINWVTTDEKIKTITTRLRDAITSNCWNLSNSDHKKAYQRMKVDTLPGFLPGGVFSTTNKDDFESYSSVVHVDFDNLTVDEETSLQQFIRSDESVFLSFRSPGGRGLKIFHKVEATQLFKFDCSTAQLFHTYAFQCITDMYKEKGLLFTGFDKSVSNINRSCYLSHDPEAFVRNDAKPMPIAFTNGGLKNDEMQDMDTLESWYLPQVQKYMTLNENEAERKIEKLIAWLQKKKLSITTDYNKWLRVIFALKATFNHSTAEKYAREFSIMDSNFNEEEFNKKFSQKISQGKAPTLGTIFHYAKELGYTNKGGVSKVEFFSGFIKALSQYRWQIRYNTMLGSLEKLTNGIWRPFYDGDMDEIKVGVFNHGYRRDIVQETLNVVAPKYNPADYLKSRIPAWDGKDHIQELLQTLDCEQGKWPLIFLSRWLMGMLAGITQHGCYNENVLVLHGSQGAGKTRWVRRLFEEAFTAFGLEPERYFKQKQINPENKDDLLLLCTSFVVFFDEMSSIVNNRADIEAFKNMTSSTSQTIRKPYGRNSEDFRRYASIIATVNESMFLIDSTGNRRFWIISVGKVNQEHSVNIPQVFAQAWHQLNSGIPYYLNAEENKELNETYLPQYEIVKAEEEIIKMFVVPSDIKKMTTTMVIEEIGWIMGQNAIKCGAANFGKLLKKHFGDRYLPSKEGRFYKVDVIRPTPDYFQTKTQLQNKQLEGFNFFGTTVVEGNSLGEIKKNLFTSSNHNSETEGTAGTGNQHSL